MRTDASGPAAVSPGDTVEVRTSGAVDAATRDCAQALISAVVTHHHRVTGHPRVRLSGPDRTCGSALVQVNLRVSGAPARIQVAARTAATAIAAAAVRLERQIRRLSTAWEPWPWPDPERQILGVPGPAPTTRRKSYRLPVGSACQAAARMDAMDYDAYLYTDAETGEDAIVYRAGPAGLCLARQHSMRPPSLPTAVPLTVNPRRVPTLTPDRAATRMAEHWLPFLFFTDPDSRRGNLLYRRYDGAFGLVTPAPGTGLRLTVLPPRTAPAR